jgi:hypothetical protein
MTGANSSGPGPFRVAAAFDQQVPCYAIRFDKQGTCTSPHSADHLVAALNSGEVTDVLLYSHGWNNVFDVAEEMYERFLDGVSRMEAQHSLIRRDFRPIFVGIFWPSTALVSPDEQGPQILAEPLAESETDAFIAELAPDDRDDARQILSAKSVPPEQAVLIAGMVADCLSDVGYDDVGGRPSIRDVLSGWGGDTEEDPPKDGFTQFGTGNSAVADPQTAGLLGNFDPRWIVRVATVLIMKDRAGVVGGHGVSELVGRILSESSVRLSLVGHSYGAKVVMSALAVRQPARSAFTALLLQPAVSRLCFAVDVGGGRAGGFRQALERFDFPIVLTHSSRDIPLHDLFQLAARRAADVGELQLAGGPSQYAALGGYGPSGYAPGECLALALPQPGQWPDNIPQTTRIVSLDGSTGIAGHGDIGTPAIFWAMLNLLR